MYSSLQHRRAPGDQTDTDNRQKQPLGCGFYEARYGFDELGPLLRVKRAQGGWPGIGLDTAKQHCSGGSNQRQQNEQQPYHYENYPNGHCVSSSSCKYLI